MSNFDPFQTPPDEFQDLESWLAAPSTEVAQVDAMVAAEVARMDVDPSAHFAAPPASDFDLGYQATYPAPGAQIRQDLLPSSWANQPNANLAAPPASAFAPVYQTTYPPPADAQAYQDPFPPPRAVQPNNLSPNAPAPGPQRSPPVFGASEPTGAAPGPAAGHQFRRDPVHQAPLAPANPSSSAAPQETNAMVTLEKKTTLPARKRPGRPKKYLTEGEKVATRRLQNRKSQQTHREKLRVELQREAAAQRTQRDADSARSEQQRLAEARSVPQQPRRTATTNVPSALDELEARIGDLVRDYDAVSRENTRLEILLRRMTGPPPPSPPNSGSESGEAGAEMERRDSGPGSSQQN